MIMLCKFFLFIYQFVLNKIIKFNIYFEYIISQINNECYCKLTILVTIMSSIHIYEFWNITSIFLLIYLIYLGILNIYTLFQEQVFSNYKYFIDN